MMATRMHLPEPMGNPRFPQDAWRAGGREAPDCPGADAPRLAGECFGQFLQTHQEK